MDAVSATPPPATPGQQLADARERQGLSRAEVAQRLHMSPWQVEALEAGEYERLPKGTFLRGFIRNYAKLVGMDSEPLVASLAQATPGHATPGIVVPSQNIRFEPLHERISASPYWKGGMIAAVVLAFGAAAFYWWAEIRNGPPPSATAAVERPAASAPQQIAVAPLPAAETPPPTPAPTIDSPAASAPASTPASGSTSAPADADSAKAGDAAKKGVALKANDAAKKSDATKANDAAKKADAAKANDRARADAARANDAPKSVTPVSSTTTVPAAGAARLAFKFHGDSWVEVRDASGKVVFSRLNGAGSEAQVAAKPPLTVIVGNAPEVTMLYNDRAFPLEPHTKVAVARFTVE